MDYNNPNDYWHGYDPYKGMSDDERMKAGCLQVIGTVVGVIIGIVLCALLLGCTTTKYVPVTEQHTEHHWHTDTVRERDSTHTERETVIRELDSAAMAKYGIQMQANQRAWLVLQREMENRLRELKHMSAKRDTVRDSIPVPYEVVKEVERQRTTSEWVFIVVGFLSLVTLIIKIAEKAKRFLP
jgi:hypothetical protein